MTFSRLAKTLSGFAIIASVVVISCTKLDTTSIGSEFVPTVDNINTFADTFDVISSQVSTVDSPFVRGEDNQALGYISNDPIFGKTSADVYAQFKPTFFPYMLGNSGDTLLGLDSVVLALSYRGAWGDTMVPQTIELRDIVDNKFRDSIQKVYRTNYAPNTGALLGSATINITGLGTKRFINNGKDSVINQIRIKITNSAYANALYSLNADAGNPSSNGFLSDSLFRSFYSGIAIKTTKTSGNALMYINLEDANSRLEIHFRKTRNGIKDTTFAALRVAPFGSSLFPSATANNIVRNLAGSEAASPTAAAQYLQTSPGNYINVSIPRLNTFKDTNKVINRAVLIIEQIPFNKSSDSIFSAPVLYVDLKDTTSGSTSIYKPIYFDLSSSLGTVYNPDLAAFFYPTTVDMDYYGGRPKYRAAGPTGSQAYYNISMTRYLQQMVSVQKINYQLRISAPFEVTYPQYTAATIPYFNPQAFGRLKLGGGAHPQYRMRVAIIWSKIP